MFNFKQFDDLTLDYQWTSSYSLPLFIILVTDIPWWQSRRYRVFKYESCTTLSWSHRYTIFKTHHSCCDFVPFRSSAGFRRFRRLVVVGRVLWICYCSILHCFIINSYFWSLGWTNSDSSNWFNNYADFCFSEFGEKVKMWITIHDPYSVAYKGYNGIHAPG